MVSKVSLYSKDVFTTGEVAKICKISLQTVIRCFDNGLIKGFRVPGSRFRRIPRSELLTFIKDNNLSVDSSETKELINLSIYTQNSELYDLFVKKLAGQFNVHHARSTFDLGFDYSRGYILVLDLENPDKSILHGILNSIEKIKPKEIEIRPVFILLWSMKLPEKLHSECSLKILNCPQDLESLAKHLKCE